MRTMVSMALIIGGFSAFPRRFYLLTDIVTNFTFHIPLFLPFLEFGGRFDTGTDIYLCTLENLFSLQTVVYKKVIEV